MIRKSLAFILIGIGAAATVQAQTPAPEPRAETRTFSMFFDGAGGYLGVQTQDVTKENFGKYGLRDVRGVAVDKVMEGSPAQAAGLQNGDVIVGFNGEEITSVRKLTRLIGEVAPDHQARITVLRGGSERELTATLGKRPTPKFENGNWPFSVLPPGHPAIPDAPNVPPAAEMPRIQIQPGAPAQPFVWQFGPRRQIGVGITPLTDQLAQHFNVTSGALINNVRDNSPAAKAGLKAGDIVVEVDGKQLTGDGDLARAIGEKKEGDITLTIVRNGNRQTVRVTPEEVKGGFDQFFEFSEPDKLMKLRRAVPATPATPAAPVPLNQFFTPGRVL
jgi:serine protease Do